MIMMIDHLMLVFFFIFLTNPIMGNVFNSGHRHMMRCHVVTSSSDDIPYHRIITVMIVIHDHHIR